MMLSAAALATPFPKMASAQAIGFTPSPISPDPAIQILDPSLAEYRVASSSLEQVATGARWLEGPVWFGDGRYLLVSDIRGRFLSRLHCQSWVSIIFLLRHHHLPNDTPQMHVGINIRESGLLVIEIHCL